MMTPPTIMRVVAVMTSASPPPPAVPAIYVFTKVHKITMNA